MVARDKAKNQIGYAVFGLICFVLYFIQYTKGYNLKIGNATAVLLVPIIVIIATFFREWVGALFGLVVGTLMDITTSGSTCFNAIALMLIGCASGLLITYLFNNNLLSAFFLDFMFVFIYFLSKWLFLQFFAGKADAVQYLLKYSLPSAFLTFIVGIPIYIIMRYIMKIINRIS